MQWRLFFRDDVKNLRAVLGGQVATLNLLLMTTTFESLCLAEAARAKPDYRQNIATSKGQPVGTANHSQSHGAESHSPEDVLPRAQNQPLDALNVKADQTHENLRKQTTVLTDLQSLDSKAQESSTSVLAIATTILKLATSGLLAIRRISQQITTMFELCNNFRMEMKIAMVDLLRNFLAIRETLTRIEARLPMGLDLPLVKFTDALGVTMGLPYQACLTWSTFKGLIGVIFTDRPGKALVDSGMYQVIQAEGGKLLHKSTWEGSIKQDDHVSMSLVLQGLNAREGYCPFPSCKAPTSGCIVVNGSRTCPKCGRSAVVAPPHSCVLVASEDCTICRLWGVVDSPEDNDQYLNYAITEHAVKELSKNNCSSDVELFRHITCNAYANILQGRYAPTLGPLSGHHGMAVATDLHVNSEEVDPENQELPDHHTQFLLLKELATQRLLKTKREQDKDMLLHQGLMAGLEPWEQAMWTWRLSDASNNMEAELPPEYY